ncbi:hypothetical protein [Slackia exigua]|uniref:hypothetical protein n=1 Tax=Slackia exigua TaxID=84109 RepID=UPI003AB96CB3
MTIECENPCESVRFERSAPRGIEIRMLESDTAVGVNGDSRMTRVAYMGRAACMAARPER